MQNLIELLRDHDINHKVENGRLLATDKSNPNENTQWVDVTSFDNHQLLEWLGYDETQAYQYLLG